MSRFIIEGCATLFEYLGVLQFLGEKIKKENLKKIIFGLLPIVLLTVTVNYFQIVSIGAIALYGIYCGIYISFYFRENWTEKILLAIIYFFLILICDYFCAAIYGNLFQIEDYMEKLVILGSIERSGYLLFNKGMLLLLSLTVRKLIVNYIPMDKLPYLVGFGSIGLIFVYVTYKFSSILALLGWSIYGIILLSCTGLFILYSKWKEAEKNRRIAEIRSLSYTLYYASIINVQKEKSRFLHDVKHQYEHMHQLLDSGNYDECREYLCQMTGYLEKQDYIQYTGNASIDFILNHKDYEAKRNQITFTIDTDFIGKMEAIEADDIHVLLGNLLDNAMEAAMLIQNEKPWIYFKLVKVHQMLFLTISNNYVQNLNVRQGKLLTTKKENHELHGIGLQSVRKIVLKYNGLMDVSYEHSIFKVEISLFL